MNSVMSPWLKSPQSCSSRSSQREPKRPLSSSPPTYPSPSGHRSSPTLGSARLCSIGSPTKPTSSRPVQSPIASAEPCARRPRTEPLGIRFCFRSALRATLHQNRTPPTSTSQGVGQNKPPKWAKPSCQSQLVQLRDNVLSYAHILNPK